jgi:hypothetical protein
MPDRSTEPAPERAYGRLVSRMDRHEDTIAYFYNVINELRERVSTLEKKLAQGGLLVSTTIAKPMNRFATCGDPRAEKGPRDRKDDQGRNDRVVQIGRNGLAA